MKLDSLNSTSETKIAGWFEPYKEAYKEKLFKVNKATEKLPEDLKKLIHMDGKLKTKQLNQLVEFSRKPEDYLEICFLAESNQDINHEEIWTSGLEKFNSSAIYLENLGYFYYQKQKYHKALDYLSRSHALEKSFFALSLAIAAAYAITQYHLAIDYYSKLTLKDQERLNEDLLVKVATSALHEEKYDLSMAIFKIIQDKKKVEPLPDLQSFLVGRFGSEAKMADWKKKFPETSKTKEAEISLDDSITYASILIHENKFDMALDYLLNVKSNRFGNN